MAKHVPTHIGLLGGIKRFTGQGIAHVHVQINKQCMFSLEHDLNIGTEKNNDDARRNYYSSNHLDITKEILLTEARLELLRHLERLKRQYIKRRDVYWKEEIYEKRRRKDDTEEEQEEEEEAE